jgi:hypothetical protein
MLRGCQHAAFFSIELLYVFVLSVIFLERLLHIMHEFSRVIMLYSLENSVSFKLVMTHAVLFLYLCLTVFSLSAELYDDVFKNYRTMEQ